MLSVWYRMACCLQIKVARNHNYKPPVFHKAPTDYRSMVRLYVYRMYEHRDQLGNLCQVWLHSLQDVYTVKALVSHSMHRICSKSMLTNSNIRPTVNKIKQTLMQNNKRSAEANLTANSGLFSVHQGASWIDATKTQQPRCTQRSIQNRPHLLWSMSTCMCTCWYTWLQWGSGCHVTKWQTNIVMVSTGINPSDTPRLWGRLL